MPLHAQHLCRLLCQLELDADVDGETVDMEALLAQV